MEKFWLDNAWIFFGMCVCLRIGVFETCLKVFGDPYHKVDPKGAKYSVSTVKTRLNLLLLALATFNIARRHQISSKL